MYDVIYFQEKWHVFVKTEQDPQWRWFGSFGSSEENARKAARALNA
jgi:hypothetical protein